MLLRSYSFAKRFIGPSQTLRGSFPNWQAACRESTGYDQPIILERLAKAAEDAVRSDGQLYERDGVLFAEPITPFPLLALLLLAAGKNEGSLNVLDFGGGFGSTYRQCQPFLTHLSSLRWDIVEQENVAAAGKQRFATDILRFYSTIDEVVSKQTPEVVIFSGVLQYLNDPYAVLASASACKPSMIVVDRNPFWDGDEDIFSLQIVSDDIFPARLPFRVFGSNSLETALAPTYRKLSEFDTVDPTMLVGLDTVRFRGKVFECTLSIQEG
jgi:putative methyltransferase (TIGR04325 family)